MTDQFETASIAIKSNEPHVLEIKRDGFRSRFMCIGDYAAIENWLAESGTSAKTQFYDRYDSLMLEISDLSEEQAFRDRWVKGGDE